MAGVLDDRLTWRPLTASDLSQVLDLRLQIEELDDTVMTALDRILDISETTRLEDQSIGGWDDYGNLLAYGANFDFLRLETPHVLLTGGVHPTHRYLQIGRKLLAWQEDQACAWSREERPGEAVRVGCFAEKGQPGLRRLLERRLYSAQRLYVDMVHTLGTLPPVEEVPQVDFVPWDQRYASEVLALHNQCFAESATAVVPDDSWAASVEPDVLEPRWSWLALNQGRVVAYALAGPDQFFAEGEHSWTDRLGVAPEFRGRGISTALLLRSLHAMAATCDSAGLGVDTDAPEFIRHLEQHLGYRTRDAITLFSRTFPASS